MTGPAYRNPAGQPMPMNRILDSGPLDADVLGKQTVRDILPSLRRHVEGNPYYARLERSMRHSGRVGPIEFTGGQAR